jgi:hypothetical protein
MEANKLTEKDQFLTLEQVNELQALGMNFSNPNAWFCKCTKNWQGNGITEPVWKLVHSMRKIVQGFEMFEYIPTLSVTELLSMLPPQIIAEGRELYFSIAHNTDGNMIVKYDNGNIDYYFVVVRKLLRDSLFEMFKLLIKNKFI